MLPVLRYDKAGLSYTAGNLLQSGPDLRHHAKRKPWQQDKKHVTSPGCDRGNGQRQGCGRWKTAEKVCSLDLSSKIGTG